MDTPLTGEDAASASAAKEAAEALLSKLGRGAAADVEILEELIALNPKGLPVSEFLRLLSDIPPSIPPAGTQAVQVASAVQAKEAYFLRKGSVCQLCAVAAPRSLEIERALDQILAETRDPFTIGDPKIEALARCLGCANPDAARRRCREHACSALVAMGTLDAVRAGQVLGNIGVEKFEYVLFISGGPDAIKRKMVEGARQRVAKKREKEKQEAADKENAEDRNKAQASPTQGGSSSRSPGGRIPSIVIGGSLVVLGLGVCDEGFWRYLWFILGAFLVLSSLLDIKKSH